mgnify:CR=1 FL=1
MEASVRKLTYRFQVIRERVTMELRCFQKHVESSTKARVLICQSCQILEVLCEFAFARVNDRGIISSKRFRCRKLG